MTIPNGSTYPETLDTDNNLFLVNDSVRMRLVEDYNPGDTSITVSGDFVTLDRLPPTGLITLTEQCSELDKRALSFYYSSFDATTNVISGLELLDGFEDVKKLKRITNVTLNVMASHHNSLKDALIAIQGFTGVKGTEDNEPFGDTLEGRINFLRRVVLQPKAWFTADKRTGNVPLEVEFENRSFRMGTDGTADEVTLTWSFGDQTSSNISLITGDSMVPDGQVDVLVRDTDGGKIKKIYYSPGIYDVELTVQNNFGSDTVVFKDFINARVKAPNEAVIRFVEDSSTQTSAPGVPPNGPFDTVPTIRSPINTLIQIEIPSGENPSTPGFSYAGELLNDDDDPIDPISMYTWSLGDDLNHPSSIETKASYSIGGVYDLKLRVDTEFGAYRITTYEDAIDIVENDNLWLWTFADTNSVRAYEYGLISETFKLASVPTLTLDRDDSFLDGVPNETQQKHEFSRNVGFAPRGTTPSGRGGTAMLYWASGRSSVQLTSAERIKVSEFNGFTGTYTSRASIVRPWNWANLNSGSISYFVFGAISDYTPNISPTNIDKQGYSLSDFSVTTTTLEASNFLNGASELSENVAIYDSDGTSIYGNYSVYRTAWKDSTGFILRNDGVGPFFRMKSFYRTEGVVANPFINIRKQQDMQGPTKLEGELVSLSTGVFFLNNSGSVSKFSPSNSTWSSGGPGVNSLLYRGLQDTTVVGFDDATNTLVAASDGDKRAYLSFDYSPNAFLKFNEIELTFSTLGSRPSGDQWLMGAY